MKAPYIKPSYRSNGFNCPYCKFFAHQSWYIIFHTYDDQIDRLPIYKESNDLQGNSRQLDPGSSIRWKLGVENVCDTSLSKCSHCGKYAFWIEDNMIFPRVSLAPLPSDDMPEDVKADYLEAMSVVETSPRASSALLRLALQKLMPHLGEKGQNIDGDIGNLVKKGLPPEVQKALDLVRVIGNESVHPGILDLEDDKETAYTLFKLLNFIVDDRITRKKEIDDLYCKLPPSKLKGIENRDSKC